MAGVEWTKDNGAESQFGKVNNSWLTDKVNSTLHLHQAPFRSSLVPVLDDNSPDFVFSKARPLIVVWGQRRIRKRHHEFNHRGSKHARENPAAAVSDTEGSKSLDFSTSKRVYFCFPQLNLENRFSQNFDYWKHFHSLADNTALFNLLFFLEAEVGLVSFRFSGPHVLHTSTLNPPLFHYYPFFWLFIYKIGIFSIKPVTGIYLELLYIHLCIYIFNHSYNLDLWRNNSSIITSLIQKSEHCKPVVSMIFRLLP